MSSDQKRLDAQAGVNRCHAAQLRGLYRVTKLRTEDDDAAQERHKRAKKNRDLQLNPQHDGMATLEASVGRRRRPTLTGLADEPGELRGVGPIPAQMTRDLAAAAAEAAIPL